MLDHPEKTGQLLATLKAAVPFEAELVPSALSYLRTQHLADNVKPSQIVSKVSYAGDEGGILCHLQSEEQKNVIIISLTHLRTDRSLPFASAVYDYQKHRVKKLRKYGAA